MSESTGTGDLSALETWKKEVRTGLYTPPPRPKYTANERSVNEVLEERGDRYGKFSDNAGVAQNIKQAMHTLKFYKLSADKQEALDQIASKISRIVTANASEYKDSWTDIQGYAKLIADTLED